MGGSFDFGVDMFNATYVDPIKDAIRDWAPDKVAYDVGNIGGNIIPLVVGLFGIQGTISSIASIDGGLSLSTTEGLVFAGTGDITISNSATLAFLARLGIVLSGASNFSDSISGENAEHAGDSIKFGSDTKSTTKLTNQMEQRGWTEGTVRDTVSKPYTIRTSINKATGNTATVYYNQQGAYVIIDDVTKAVVQVSDNINPSAWIPDTSIVNPFKP